MADIVTREEKEIDKVGRPCKYESHVQPRLNEVLEWIQAGYTDYSIADTLGVGYSTWMKYKAEILELQEVYTRARTSRNALVMNSQFESAKGIKETVKKPIKLKKVKYKDGKKVSEEEYIEYVDEYVYVPPNTNAADLFLRNNDPEYKSAKMDVSSLTLVQNNYNLDELEAKRLEILKELKHLESATDADFKVISDS